MASFFEESLFFGMAVSLIAYGLGLLLKKKLKWAFLNPLLLSIIVVILFLQVLHVDYETYNSTARYLSYLSDTGYGLPGHSALSAAEALKRESAGCGSGDRLRRHCQHGRHLRAGSGLWPQP